jgi:tight adherence protein B
MPAIEIILLTVVISVVGGYLGTRYFAEKRKRERIRKRLEMLFGATEMPSTPATVLKAPVRESIHILAQHLPGLPQVRTLLVQAGYEGKLTAFFYLCAILILMPLVIASVLDIDSPAVYLVSLVLSTLPLMFLFFRAAQRKTKFSEQLPDAIDLMVAVLKSGHSIPQAVKAVADEIPAPCGTEMAEVVHRMNLGQPLSNALLYSAQRYKSYELDLIRRAVGIQAEVGGSLAELLDKTNQTLRRRLKLIRQVRVLTAQSRLTAIIVGLLPFVLAATLEYTNPGYMQPLFNTLTGKVLLVAALMFQALGVVIMTKLSTMKV